MYNDAILIVASEQQPTERHEGESGLERAIALAANRKKGF